MEMACLDLINSEFRDFRGRWLRDDLLQAGWLEQFLDRWSLQIAMLPDSDILAVFVELRVLLLGIEAKSELQYQKGRKAQFYSRPPASKQQR